MFTPHPTPSAVLTVDLDAIAANWRLLSARLAPGCRAAAVVKADGYGLGAVTVAAALARAGCRRFFVATLDEGIALRAALAEGEILVMNGLDPASAEFYPRHRLIPVLNDAGQAEFWQRFAGDRLPAALQVDSGMSRLGLAPGELAAAIRDWRPILLMSHLACADEPDHPLNRQQLRDFAAARAMLPGVEASLAASSGIFLGAEFHADWVRPGAALYGVNPTPGQANPMAPALRLAGKILQLREIDADRPVGYGATHRTRGPSRLATVALGYADGLLRSLSNRGHGRIGERSVPLIGRVSMDVSLFDVSSVPPAELAAAEFVELIGGALTIDDLARDAGTIGYEVLTALGPRVHRRYVGAAAP